jgi:Fur family peroxide stress response transcriptional regulator
VIDTRGKYKRSRQRERILELLRSTGRHPTADWVYEQLKGEFPNLSMGTVYRNLKILMDQRLIKKIDFGSTFDRFDANIGPHYHFVCERCGAIIDLELPIDESLNQRVNGATPYAAHRHRIEFFGLCDRCGRGNG